MSLLRDYKSLYQLDSTGLEAVLVGVSILRQGMLV